MDFQPTLYSLLEPQIRLSGWTNPQAPKRGGEKPLPTDYYYRTTNYDTIGNRDKNGGLTIALVLHYDLFSISLLVLHLEVKRKPSNRQNQ